MKPGEISVIGSYIWFGLGVAHDNTLLTVGGIALLIVGIHENERARRNGRDNERGTHNDYFR